MRCAVVKIATGLVDNVIVADPLEDTVPEGFVLIGNVPDFVTLGTLWDGKAFVKPIEPPQNAPPVTVAGLEML
jgi:hypothetical protein